VNARYLARAGFAQGQWLSIQIREGALVLRVVEAVTGKRVQEKNGHPLIDLNAKFLRDVFGSARTLHVRVSEKEIVLSVHPIEAAVDSRPTDRTMGSIFAGAGLLDEAGVQAGFTPAWAIEIDRRIADVYSQNHPSAVVYEMSAHEAAFTSLRPVELLVLGLPCQPWSTARSLNSDGSKVDRSHPLTEHPLGDMAFWAFSIIAKVNPRTIVLECAPGFIKGEMWASFSGALRRLNYAVESRVINAYDHGALTKRRRTVMVATTPSISNPVAPWPDFAPESRRPSFATVLESDVPEAAWWDRSTKPWVFRVNDRNAEKGNGFGLQVVTPDSTSCGTITAEYGETKNDQPVVSHPPRPDTYRYFTLVEGRRLFGLRETYHLPPAKTFAWRLLGQAVHVPTFSEIIRRATSTRHGTPASSRELEDLPLFAGA
jgi:DNA (cytosine-5)-methyltransferase 1